MRKKFVTIGIIILLVLSGFIGIMNFENESENSVAKAATLYVGGSGGGNYTKIQWAIENASSGDTVYVYNGHYNETVIINKTINLIGENMHKTIINGTGYNVSVNGSGNQTYNITIVESVIYVYADNVLISGFTVKNSGSSFWDAGIELENVKYCTIKNNNISSNEENGILLFQSNNITIENNLISSNKNYGLYLYYSDNNTIFNNTFIKDNIFLSYSSNNTIELNDIHGASRKNSGNGINIIYHSNNNLITNNDIKNWRGNGIEIVFVENNTISNNIIKNNGHLELNYSGTSYGGIEIYYSNKNIISGNIIKRNENNGIYSRNSNNNFIMSNRIHNNSIGIYWASTDTGNKIYLNELKNNTHQNTSGIKTYRHWNSSLPMGYIYNNTNFTSYLGNYWGDYNGTDSDGDGIGDTPYKIGNYGNNTEQDLYPLMKTMDNYIIIPTSIKVDLDATSSNSTNITVWLNVREKKILHAKITGILNGTIIFKNLQIVTINSSYFAGKGFFTANWDATIEGKQYHGKWHGMLFNRSSDNKTYLKGTLSGGLKGITDGYFNNSNLSSKLLFYNSTWTISHLGSDLIFAQLNVQGILTNLTSKNFKSEIYILQISCKGNASGYYNGSLDVVLTHVRINNNTNKYHGHGFSFITFTSTYGTGQGWTFDYMSSKDITKLTGFFTEPLWGFVFGKIDESGTTPKLTLSIVRVDLGLPPRAILALDVWGRSWVSPGQTSHIFIEFKNYGLKGVNDTKIFLQLPKNVTYKSSTCGGTYNNSTHEVTWRFNISAKSKKVVSVKCKVKWGLSQGTKLVFHGYIQNYIEKITYVKDWFTSIVRVAWDPNVKYGPDGNVTKGQELNYNIEFENEGVGIAFGVYFTDELSEYLDESSLKIGPVISTKNSSVIAPPGTYNSATRTITWLVGVVGPKEGGHANISIKVRDDALPSTEILNYATVYFPSVPEVTRTNGIVSIVRPNQDPIANAGDYLAVLTYQNIIFNGSNSNDPDGSIVNYTWDFGDGKLGFGLETSHAYSDDGNYTVTLTVGDNVGAIDIHEIYVTILNRAPVAKLQVDSQDVKTKQKVTFNASKSSDMDGTVSEYYFDFGDGTNSGWVQTQEVTHKYSDGTKTYKAKLSVKDDDGDSSTNTEEIQITVNNREPMAELSVDLNEAYTFEDIVFSAELSADIDGQISSYFFDFGDGTDSGWVTTKSIKHQYTDGTSEYTISLKVKDDDGIVSPDLSTLNVLIKNRKPEPSLIADKLQVETFEDVLFDASSSTDMDGNDLEYYFDFGDGTDSGWVTDPVTSHSFTDGTQDYKVQLTVRDDDSETSKMDIAITVNNRAPKADAGSDQTVEENQVVQFTGGSSSDKDGTINSYAWDFGDGSSGTGKKPSHIYAEDGKYTVTLTVRDDDGATDKNTCVITVGAKYIKPMSKFSVSPDKGDINTEFEFKSEAYDTDGIILKFNWDFGDGETSTQANPTHQYKNSGEYVVSLMVQDDDGLNSELYKQTLKLTNLPPIAIAKASSASVKTEETITFDALDSYDIDSEILTFTWQFGDGSSTKGKEIQHSYKDKGTYTVTLTIHDDSNNVASTTLKLEITEPLPDFDGDEIPDDLDPDDDNDGLPDLWEQKYELDQFDPDDANIDSDDDELLNKEEYLINTNPTNPDTDSDGYNDKYDPYPLDPGKRPSEEKTDEVSQFDIQPYLMLIVIILLILVAIIPLVLRKRRRGMLGEPYTEDPALREVSEEVLTDSDDQNLRMSRNNVKSKLEKSREKGEISEETYKYIRKEILYSKEHQQDQIDTKNK